MFGDGNGFGGMNFGGSGPSQPLVSTFNMESNVSRMTFSSTPSTEAHFSMSLGTIFLSPPRSVPLSTLWADPEIADACFAELQLNNTKIPSQYGFDAERGKELMAFFISITPPCLRTTIGTWCWVHRCFSLKRFRTDARRYMSGKSTEVTEVT